MIRIKLAASSMYMEKFVDIRKLIKSKNPKLLKWLPQFAIRWIEKIIHEEEVNKFMIEHKNADLYTFCEDAVDYLNLRFTMTGREHIPRYPKKVIFTANHPLGGMDAISIIHLLKDTRTDIKFIVNDLLMVIRHLKDHFIGVNKVGKNAVKSLQKVEEQFATGTATFIFPAGLVSRKVNREIMDLEWKKTFITKAKKYHIPVIPVYIGGRLTNRFYKLANLRKFMGIKVNIEMFFLVDELFKQKDMEIDIIIGQPIDPELFDKSKNDKEWAEWMKKRVYDLRETKSP
ncbi:MAG: 1-acyl-sn-glycerol-3-phosphate acyltransferase [Bacteroidota bacterium]